MKATSTKQAWLKLNSHFSHIILSASLAVAMPVYAQNYYQQAANDYQAGEYQSAVIRLKNFLVENPEDIQGRILLGKTYVATEKYDNAIKEFKRAKELGDTSDEVSLRLARVYLRQGQYQQVLVFLSADAFSDNRSKGEAYAIIGHALIGNNQIADAKDVFAKATNLAASPFSKIGQARIFAIEGDIQQAYTLLDEVLNVDAKSFDALLIKGQLLSAEQKHEQALNYYDSAILLRKNNLIARLARAETHTLLNQPDDAQKDLDWAFKVSPALPAMNYLQARLFLLREQYQPAQQAAENVLNVAPDYLAAHFISGAAHYAQNNFGQARIHLEKFLLNQPVHIVGTRLLAATYLKLNNPNAVINLLKPLNEYDSINDAGLLGLLGTAYLQVGDAANASQHLSKALTLNPKLTEAKIQLATSQLMSGDLENSISQLQSIVTQRGNDKLTDLLLITTHLKNNEPERALELIQQRINSTPNKPDYYHIQGLTLQLLNKETQAKQAFERALNVDKNYVPTLLTMSKSALKDKQFNAAKELLLQILKIDSSNITAMMMLAQTSRETKDNMTELNWLSRARDKNTDAIEPLRLLVDFYLRNNEQEKAVSEATKYQLAHPKNHSARSLLANALFKSNEYAEAEFHLWKIISDFPADITHRLLLAQTLTRLKNNTGALEQVNQVLSTNADYLPALAVKAEVLILDKNYVAAKGVSTHIRELYPEQHIADQLMGDILRAENKLSEAIPYYEKAFATNQTANLVHILNALYFYSGETDLALKVLTQYLEQHPDDELARLKLASGYQQSNRPKLATNHYETLLEKHPDNLAALNNLAWIHQLDGDIGLEYAEKAYNLSPKNPDISDTYGWVLIQTGHVQHGLEILQQTVNIAPGKPDVRYHLAVALEKNGKKDQSIKELKRLLRDYQGFGNEPQARALLTRLGG